MTKIKKKTYVWLYRLDLRAAEDSETRRETWRIGEWLAESSWYEGASNSLAMWKSKPPAGRAYEYGLPPGEFVRVCLDGLVVAPLPKRKPKPKTKTVRKIVASGSITSVDFNITGAVKNLCGVIVTDDHHCDDVYAELNRSRVIDLLASHGDDGPYDLVEITKRRVDAPAIETARTLKTSYEIFPKGASGIEGV
jgi:hypothetical protein